jgi:hypothetical protein
MAIAIMIKTFESVGATYGPKKPRWGHTFCPTIPHCTLCLQLFGSLVIVLLVQHSLQFMPFFLVCICLFVHAILSGVYVCLFVCKVVQRFAKGTWGMRLCNRQVYIVGMQFMPWQRFWGFNLQVQAAMSFFLQRKVFNYLSWRTPKWRIQCFIVVKNPVYGWHVCFTIHMAFE